MKHHQQERCGSAAVTLRPDAPEFGSCRTRISLCNSDFNPRRSLSQGETDWT